MDIEVEFDATIGTVRQSIEIKTNDTPEEFVAKLQKGEYFTTMSPPFR